MTPLEFFCAWVIVAGIATFILFWKGPPKPTTNLAISKRPAGKTYHLMRRNFTSALAYWLNAQSPYYAPDMSKAIAAFDAAVEPLFKSSPVVEFTAQHLHDIVSGTHFASIPEIEILNHRKNGRNGMGFCSRYDQPQPDDDFIDLDALARNVLYMIIRESEQ